MAETTSKNPRAAARQNLFLDEPLDEQLGSHPDNQVSKSSFTSAQLPGDFQERAGIGAADSETDNSGGEDSEDESENEDGSEDSGAQSEFEQESEQPEEEEADEAEQDEADRAAELEAGRNQSRQAEAVSATAGEDKKKSGAANQALSGALKAAWENLITSFLTSILWIDLHVFFNRIGLKMFCKLGEEWVPKEIAESDPEKAKQMGEKLNLPESMGCCAVNGCCGFIIMIAIVIVSFIVWVSNNLFDSIVSIFKGLF